MAAGLGFKTFTTGEVLTAADVNGYLMQGILVFASEAARNSAITSPQEGQFAFTKDNNSLWYYTGSAWVASGATGDIEGVTAGVGISGGGTSGTVTITNDMATTITAAGDIVVGTGSGTYDNLPIGTTGQVLTADTTVSPYKVKWAAASAASYVGVRAITSSASVSYTAGTDTAIPFAAEDFDTDAFHDNSTNNSRITIPTGKGGKYLITGQLELGISVTSYLQLRLYKNGSLLNAQLGRLFNWSASGQPMITGSTVLSLAAGDYIQLMATVSDTNASTSTYASFTATFLGA